jgi:hypothetical protein
MRMLIGELAKRARVPIDTTPCDAIFKDYAYDRRSVLDKPTAEMLAWLLEQTMDLLKQTNHMAMSRFEMLEFESYQKKCSVAVQLISGELLSPIYRRCPELRREISDLRTEPTQDGIDLDAFNNTL